MNTFGKLLTLSGGLVARGLSWNSVVKSGWHKNLVPLLLGESMLTKNEYKTLMDG